MLRSLVLLLTTFCLFTAVAFRGLALTDEEKKEKFLESQEEMKTVPRKSVTPKPKPKPKPAARPKLTAKPKPKPKKPKQDDDDEKPAPKPSKSPSPASKQDREERQSEPKPSAAPAPSPARTPAASPSHTPAHSPSASPSISQSPALSGTTAVAPAPDAAVTIEKSGLEKEEGYVPPEPEPQRWWMFGGPKYKYLTRSIRAEIDRAKVKRKRWRYVVVHNSGSRQGNAKIFDYYHRNVRKMPNGLAYHFVIGNGRSSGDGEIEIGERWKRQINGGHVHSDYLNNIAVGICLVGDFNRDVPTRAQLEALDELIRYLRGRVGKTEGKPAAVLPHKRINPPRWPTDCPGDRFPYNWFRRFD